MQRCDNHVLLNEKRIAQKHKDIGIFGERLVGVRLDDLLDGAAGVEGLRHGVW